MRRRDRHHDCGPPCAWAGLLLAGCWGTPVGVAADPEASSTSSGSNPSASITVTITSAASAVTQGTSASDGSGDDTHGATTVPFLLEPDAGHHFECDIFIQDCPSGEKCVAWAYDGGNDWNATKCVPIPDEPAGVGEACHVMGSETSGLDDCDLGAMCLYVDAKTLAGICVAFCIGDEANPYCEEPSAECLICDDACLPLCIPSCSPLEQDCPEDQACYPIQDGWHCGRDASGEQGGYGDPCSFINVCDPGLICLNADTVPPGQPCEGSAGCCTEVCDLSDPAGDLQCMGAAEGQTCQAWYEEGNAPPGFENVGACALPQ